MAQFLKFMLTGVLTLGLLTNCGVGLESDDDSDIRANDKSDKLKREYDRISGMYVGDVVYPTAEGDMVFTARMNLLSVMVFDGPPTESGRPIGRPVLSGNFRLNDIVQDTDYVSFKGSFRRQGEGGKLVLAYESERTNLTGQISWQQTENGESQKTFVGSIIKPGGQVAEFRLTYAGPADETPDTGKDRRDRISRMYEPLEGTYRNTAGPNQESWAFYYPAYRDELCREIPDRCTSGIPFEIKFFLVDEPFEGQMVRSFKVSAIWVGRGHEWTGYARYSPFDRTLSFSGNSNTGSSVLSGIGTLRDGRVVFDRISLAKGPYVSFTGTKVSR